MRQSRTLLDKIIEDIQPQIIDIRETIFDNKDARDEIIEWESLCVAADEVLAMVKYCEDYMPSLNAGERKKLKKAFNDSFKMMVNGALMWGNRIIEVQGKVAEMAIREDEEESERRKQVSLRSPDEAMP